MKDWNNNVVEKFDELIGVGSDAVVIVFADSNLEIHTEHRLEDGTPPGEVAPPQRSLTFHSVGDAET